MSLIVGLCLAALAFNDSADAAGSSAMGWGENFMGQTGNGEFTQTGCYCVPTPTSVSGLTDATQISGGCCSTLVLHANGAVTAWGRGRAGQLGNGTTEDSNIPVQVIGLNNVVAVAAGYEHNLALQADGSVLAWGDNYSGGLGVDDSGPETCGISSVCSKVPIPVPGVSNAVAIAASYYFSFALLADGTVMAWGADNTGQLGRGTGSPPPCECIDHAVPVPGVSGAMAISGGESHGLALLGDGTVRVWGSNQLGQVGDGTAIAPAPGPGCVCVGPTAPGGLPGPVSAASAGNYHNLALLGDGNPQAWGENRFGQLGDGTTSPMTGCGCVPSPRAISGLSGVTSVAGGEYHSMALLGDGTVRAWGRNIHSEVGDGTQTERNAPVPVGGLSGVSDIVAGEATSFALTGPSHTLTVELAGAGAGVVGGPEGIICPAADCAARFPDSQVEILRSEAALGNGFAGFTGPCAGTGPCQVRMDADKTVTATFGPPKGTAITRANIKQGKKAKKRARRKPKPKATATFGFSTPGLVSDYQCMLVRPKAKRKKARKRKPRFAPCSSPKRYKKLRKGRYTFMVRARNGLGTEAQPAVRKFKIRH